MISFRIDDGGTIQRITTLRNQAKNPRAMMLAGGRGISNLLKKHYREKNRKEPNKLGGSRENFWNRIGQSVQTPVVNSAATVLTVSITDPRLAQKIFGGRIRALRVRNLAIPQTPEAYGRSPRTFEAETGYKLVMITQRTQSKFSKILARHVEGGRLQVEYLLTPRVYQDPDPTALPTMAAITVAFLKPAEAAVRRQTEENE